MKKWKELPEDMKTDEVKKYYDILQKRAGSLVIKRIFDFIASALLLIILSPLLLIISICIKADSKGSIMFRQVRVTTYGKRFRIFKFRTMVMDADKNDLQVTTKGDARVTRIGKVLRKYRLDEMPQLFNVLSGDMSFVGTRPEVDRYVKMYTDEMKATLLLPAGITSMTSIAYRDEAKLLESAADADIVYIEEIMPEKMKYNLKALKEFSVVSDVKIILRTCAAIIK